MMKYLFWLKQLMAAKKHPTPSPPPLLPSKMHYLPKGSRNPSLNPVSGVSGVGNNLLVKFSAENKGATCLWGGTENANSIKQHFSQNDQGLP